MKRRYSQNEDSHPTSAIASQLHSLKAAPETGSTWAPPSKLRRQGSKLLSALKFIASRTHGKVLMMLGTIALEN